MIHPNPTSFAGQTVTADLGSGPGPFKVEDWWDRVSGGSWMYAEGNRAALAYAMRSGLARLPMDNEVLYGKDQFGLGHLLHVSEVQS